MLGDEDLRRGNGARVRGRGRGAPGSWTPQIDAGCSCGGDTRVREIRGSPAAKKFGAAEVPAAAQSSPGGEAERGVGLELGGPGGGSGEG